MGSRQLQVSVLDSILEDDGDCGPCSIAHSLEFQCGVSHYVDCKIQTKSLMSIFLKMSVSCAC